MNTYRRSKERPPLDRIILREVVLPQKEPFRTAWGEENERRLLIVEAQCGHEVGFGEVSALSTPLYTEETVDTAWYVLERFLIPRAFTTPWQGPEHLAEHLRPIRRHYAAKAGLEGAIWDLYSRRQGLSLAEALTVAQTKQGGEGQPRPKHRIAAGAVLGFTPDLRTLERRAGELLNRGYQRLKVKIKPGWDVAPLEHLRMQFGSVPLMADANASYTLADLSALRRLDSLELLMIEQPLAHDDIVDHARLQDELTTPICLDESLCTAEDTRKALALGSCRIVCIKPARVGGLSEARRIHDLCFERNVPVWCGGMLESGIGKAQALALATLPGFTIPGDFSPSDRYWKEDLIDPPIPMDRDGYIPLPTGSGIGVHVRREALERLTVRAQEFEGA